MDKIELLKEFDEKLEEPDLSNSGYNSPKVWMFEGYIACKKEAKDFLLSTISKVLQEVKEGTKYEFVGMGEEEGYLSGYMEAMSDFQQLLDTIIKKYQ